MKQFFLHLFLGILLINVSCTNNIDKKASEIKKIFAIALTEEKLTKPIISSIPQEDTTFLTVNSKKSNFKTPGVYSFSSENPYVGTVAIELNGSIKKLSYSYWVKVVEGTKVAPILQDQKNSDLLYIKNTIAQRVENGWMKQTVTFTYYKECHSESIVAYLYCSKGNGVVRDIELAVWGSNGEPYAGIDTLQLDFKKKNWQTIKSVRSTALEKGILQESFNEKVKGKLIINGKTEKVEARLKGDWPDHWQHDKWSFRLKLGGGGAYKGMTAFNIQNPFTRGFMAEYVVHRFAEEVGLLVPQYDLSNVFVNGEFKGVYAVEEHFRKELIERNERREGPILKWNESLFWDYVERDPYAGHPNFFTEISPIETFGEGRLKKKKAQERLFLQARNQLTAYLEGKISFENCFDLNQFAKWVALFDIIGVNHGITWHNVRFYFNPLNSKLEPIVYDCYTEKSYPNHENIPRFAKLDERMNFDHAVLLNGFKNERFRALYLKYLNEYTADGYIEDFYRRNEADFKLKTDILYEDTQLDNIGDSYLLETTRIMRDYLRANGTFDPKAEVSFTPFKHKTKLLPSRRLVFVYENGDDLEITNLNEGPVTLVLTEGKKKDKEKTEITVPAHSSLFDYASYAGKQKSDKIEIKLQDEKEEITTLPYEAPRFVVSPANNTTNPSKIPGKRKGTAFVWDKDITLDKFINIPGELIVKGATIRLQKGAGILVQGAVQFNNAKFIGEEGNFGVTVFNGKDSSIVTNSSFHTLSNPQFESWSLTGAVTFYQGHTAISNTRFMDNQSEDGLNIFNGSFVMDSSEVSNTYADAFDGDFVAGLITNSYFENAGNDAIDFSGSQIDVENCTFVRIGDKAISGGEMSTVRAKNCIIDEANFGAASKDGSTVTIVNSTIKNSKIGLAAYCKKDEYGPATMIANAVNMEANGKASMLGFESILLLDDAKTVGTEKVNIDSIYEPFRYQRQ